MNEQKGKGILIGLIMGVIASCWGFAIESINPLEPRHLCYPSESITLFLIGLVIIVVWLGIWLLNNLIKSHISEIK